MIRDMHLNILYQGILPTLKLHVPVYQLNMVAITGQYVPSAQTDCEWFPDLMIIVS